MNGSYQISPNAMLVGSSKGYKIFKPAFGESFDRGGSLCTVQEQPNGDWYESCIYIAPNEMSALANMFSVASEDLNK